MYRTEAQLTAGRQKQAGSKQGHSTRRIQASTRGKPRGKGKGERSLHEQGRRGGERKAEGSQLEWRPETSRGQAGLCTANAETAAKFRGKETWAQR